MKKIFPFFFAIFLSVFTSCEKDIEAEEIAAPTNFSISTANIDFDSVNLNWSATISDGSTLTYDIYLNGIKVKGNFSGTQYTIEQLSPETNYSGKIIVKSSNGKSVTKQYSFATNVVPAPSSFSVNTSEIGYHSVKITWTEATTANNSEITYSIYLDGDILEGNAPNNSYSIDNLKPNTSYIVKIIATSTNGLTSEKESTFTTSSSPPSSFPLHLGSDAFDTTDPYWLQVNWTPPTVEDGSDYYFTIYLNDEIVFNYLTETANKYIFQNLEENTEYTVKIVADAQNGTVTEEIITFTTIVYPTPTAFELTVNAITQTTAVVNWETSTIPNGGEVTYYVYLDGVQNHPEFTHIGGSPHVLENLSPGTTYTVTVLAKGSYGTKEVTREVATTFTTDYALHPTLSIEKATLYTPDSQYFAGQLNVKFSENIDNVTITEFHAGDIDIPNFIFYPTTISSGILSNGDYNSVANNKTGYVFISENGVTYKIPFTVIIETS